LVQPLERCDNVVLRRLDHIRRLHARTHARAHLRTDGRCRSTVFVAYRRVRTAPTAAVLRPSPCAHACTPPAAAVPPLLANRTAEGGNEGSETRPIDRTTAAQRIMWPTWHTLIVSRPKHRLTCGGPARLNLMPAFCSMMRSMPVSRTDANVTHTPSLPARPARCAAGCTLWSPSARPPGRFATAFRPRCAMRPSLHSAVRRPRTPSGPWHTVGPFDRRDSARGFDRAPYRSVCIGRNATVLTRRQPLKKNSIADRCGRSGGYKSRSSSAVASAQGQPSAGSVPCALEQSTGRPL
jgi:hypothetical protein